MMEEVVQPKGRRVDTAIWEAGADPEAALLARAYALILDWAEPSETPPGETTRGEAAECANAPEQQKMETSADES